MSKTVVTPVPKVGDQIYIPHSLFLSHGRDDIHGGQAKVRKVTEEISGGKKVAFVYVEGIFRGYNWDQYLAGEQEQLKALFGSYQAHPDPDDRPEFNRP